MLVFSERLDAQKMEVSTVTFSGSLAVTSVQIWGSRRGSLILTDLLL